MLLTGLGLGAILGFVLQRGRFCVTTAFRDLWIARSSRWFTAFLLAITVHAVGLLVLTSTGLVSAQTPPLALVATVVGGFIFGFGIVLAGGCATGTYYRAGEGLVGSWIALIFYALFAGIMKYGPLAGFTDRARARTVDVTTIPATLGVSPWIPATALAVGVGYLVHRHTSGPRLAVAALPARRTGLAHILLEKRWSPFVTGTLVGLVGTLAWPLSAATGRNAGLGITTPSADLATYLVTGQSDLVDWGVLLVLGILVGSHLAARASGEFRVRVPDAKTTVHAVLGGALMGVGASLAGGCTIGLALVATAQLAWAGWIGMSFMILGTGLAAHLFITRPGRAARPDATPVAVRAS